MEAAPALEMQVRPGHSALRWETSGAGAGLSRAKLNGLGFSGARLTGPGCSGTGLNGPGCSGTGLNGPGFSGPRVSCAPAPRGGRPAVGLWVPAVRSMLAAGHVAVTSMLAARHVAVTSMLAARHAGRGSWGGNLHALTSTPVPEGLRKRRRRLQQGLRSGSAARARARPPAPHAGHVCAGAGGPGQAAAGEEAPGGCAVRPGCGGPLVEFHF